MKESKLKKIFLQSFACLIALAVAATGIRHLLKGDTSYQNWWGGLVFAPLTIIGGILLLYVVIFKWDKLRRMK
jgi:uncharacterized membrane protein YcjF (UPF0283 family)